MANGEESDLPCLADELKAVAERRPSTNGVLNFSRPRPLERHKVYHDRHDSATHISEASAAERTKELLTRLPPLHPPPPVSRGTDITTSAASEFSWDHETGELRSRQSDVNSSGRPSMALEQALPTTFDIGDTPSSTASRTSLEERSMSTTAPSASSSSSLYPRGPMRNRSLAIPVRASSSSITLSRSRLPLVAELPGDQPQARPRFINSSASSPTPTWRCKGILRPPSSSRTSERTSSRTSTAESERSHHTVSEDLDAAAAAAAAQQQRWRGSDYDTSELSVRQVQKLRKKGVNPSLYAEMKAARKGKNKWVGSLTGNSFLG